MGPPRILVIDDETEIREAIAQALEWRTSGALQRASGMSEKEVLKVIETYPNLIRHGKTASGESIWTLQERYWKRPGFTQILDFMSNTSTSSSSS